MMMRLGIVLALLAVLALAEFAWPRHPGPARRTRRWPVNFALGALNVVCLRVLVPWAALDAAIWAQAHAVGALNLLPLPTTVAAVGGFLALDLVIYLQHRLMHRVGWLWRLHRVHHTDLALDVSSGVRFHPLEILLSMGIKMAAVLLLGPAPAVVMTFEIVLSAFSLYTHTNVAVPVRLDALLRWILVTPDMHRIHHSIRRVETDSNFCFHLSCWDRLLGTYRAQAAVPQVQITLGIEVFRKDEEQRLPALLAQPFKGASGLQPDHTDDREPDGR
jgi:sterol desaturase/sphingolipid hydroxylase (fatty acid hydroxylase superfamily)